MRRPTRRIREKLILQPYRTGFPAGDRHLAETQDGLAGWDRRLAEM
jgi:hypothetical protein